MRLTAFIKRHWYPIAVVGVLLLAILFRFYHFSSRWGLAFDQAHDVLVAREGLRRRTLPLMGPFASGANIVGGPQWYWTIVLFSALAPRWMMAPWVGLGLLSVFFVFLIMKIGEVLGGRRLAIFAGLLAAFSPLQTSQSVSLTNQSPMALITALAIWVMLKFLKSKRLVFAFLLGTLVAVGVNVHLQGVGLLFLVPATVLLSWPFSIVAVGWFSLGFALQFVPLAIVELQTNFYNLNGLIDYLLVGQHQQEGSFVWGTYLFSFWPRLITKIIGGFPWLIGSLLLVFVFLLTKNLVQRKISKKWLVTMSGFGLIFLSLRFYQGPKFESYFVFIHPFIFLLVAWVINQIWRLNKMVAISLLVLLMIGALQQNIAHYQYEKNSTYLLIKNWRQELGIRFPGQKFAVYDYQFKSRGKTASLALFLDTVGLIADNGVKIGVSRCALRAPGEPFLKNGYCLTNISDLKVEGDDWAFHNPSEIWKATEEWYHIKNE